VDDLLDVSDAAWAKLQMESGADRTNIMGQRMFTTRDGFIGMGSHWMQKNDKVYVLLGCNVPVILRPVSDYFEFVGDRYIHGFIWGEAVEDLDQGKRTEETVNIR
jgi:hypothetical protein